MTPREELLARGLNGIHEDSATTWAARALAAKQLFAETGDLKWAAAFADLRHEAIEHAALSEDLRFLDGIRGRLAGQPPQ